MESSILIWDPLINAWAHHGNTRATNEAGITFAERVMFALFHKVCEPLSCTAFEYAKAKRRQKAATIWLCHILERGSRWAELLSWHFQTRETEEAFIEALLLQSTACCLRVAKIFLERGDQKFQDEWRPLYDAIAGGRDQEISTISRVQDMEDVETMEVELPPLMEEAEARQFLESDDDESVPQIQEHQGGWKRDNGYRPYP